ncbi:hypothetical protein M0Q50_02325 [bacterium]|jgi:hypothetical protein|nr:hypothetical protein [bacterium]
MKTFESFIKPEEKTFLKLSHLNDLEIKFHFIEHQKEMFYFYKKDCLFFENREVFFVTYIWDQIEIDDPFDFFTKMINKYFNNNKRVRDHSNVWWIENNFNI